MNHILFTPARVFAALLLAPLIAVFAIFVVPALAFMFRPFIVFKWGQAPVIFRHAALGFAALGFILVGTAMIPASADDMDMGMEDGDSTPAMLAAMANIPVAVHSDGGGRYSIGAGLAFHNGRQGLALGAQTLVGNFTVHGSVAFDESFNDHIIGFGVAMRF